MKIVTYRYQKRTIPEEVWGIGLLGITGRLLVYKELFENLCESKLRLEECSRKYRRSSYQSGLRCPFLSVAAKSPPDREGIQQGSGWVSF